MALARPRLVALLDAILAVHVAARQDDLIFVLVAGATLHLREPVVELEVHVLLVIRFVQLKRAL